MHPEGEPGHSKCAFLAEGAREIVQLLSDQLRSYEITFLMGMFVLYILGYIGHMPPVSTSSAAIVGSYLGVLIFNVREMWRLAQSTIVPRARLATFYVRRGARTIKDLEEALENIFGEKIEDVVVNSVTMSILILADYVMLALVSFLRPRESQFTVMVGNSLIIQMMLSMSAAATLGLCYVLRKYILPHLEHGSRWRLLIMFLFVAVHAALLLYCF